MKNNNKNKPIRYFGEIQYRNGRYKVKFVQRLIGINQHKRKWTDIDPLSFAKELNSKLITN
jgi:hypothetical protein